MDKSLLFLWGFILEKYVSSDLFHTSPTFAFWKFMSKHRAQNEADGKYKRKMASVNIIN